MIAAGVLVIVLASASLAFVLGGGLGGTDLPTSSSPAAVATLAPATGGSAQAPSSAPATSGPTAGAGTPAATDATTATATATATATPEESPMAGIRAKRIRIDRLGINLASRRG